jgi:hypothetical protein
VQGMVHIGLKQRVCEKVLIGCEMNLKPLPTSALLPHKESIYD